MYPCSTGLSLNQSSTDLYMSYCITDLLLSQCSTVSPRWRSLRWQWRTWGRPFSDRVQSRSPPKILSTSRFSLLVWRRMSDVMWSRGCYLCYCSTSCLAVRLGTEIQFSRLTKMQAKLVHILAGSICQTKSCHTASCCVSKHTKHILPTDIFVVLELNIQHNLNLKNHLSIIY